MKTSIIFIFSLLYSNAFATPIEIAKIPVDPSDNIRSISLSQDASRILVNGYRSSSVWNVQTESLESEINHLAKSSMGLLSNNGDFVYLFDTKGLKKIDTKTSTVLTSESLPSEEYPTIMLDKVERVLDTNLALSAAWNGNVHLWDLNKAKHVRTFEVYSKRENGGHTTHFTVSTDGQTLVTTAPMKYRAYGGHHWYNILKIWNLHTGKLLCEVRDDKNSFLMPTFVGKQLFAIFRNIDQVVNDQTLTEIDMSRCKRYFFPRKQHHIVEAVGKGVTSIAKASTGLLYARLDMQSSYYGLWNGGVREFRVGPSRTVVRSVSQFNNYTVTTDSDYVVKFWDLNGNNVFSNDTDVNERLLTKIDQAGDVIALTPRLGNLLRIFRSH